MRSSKGQELQVHYDDKNRVDYNLSRVNGNLVKTKYSYTDLATSGYNTKRSGQMAQIKVNNTLTSEYVYDELGRTTQTKLYTGGTNQSYRTEYGYLPGAGPKDTTTLVNHVKRGNVSCDYTYDAAGNILTVTENGELKISYQYDELNQLVREDNTYLGVTKTYTYDLAGNLLQKKEYTGAQHGVETLGTPAETISYSYPSTGWKDQLAGYNGQSITYDQIGNPLQYWNGMEFTWANGRQLTGIANGSHTVSYQYDSNSIRTKKTVDGVTTEYFLNGSTVLTQVTGDTQLDFFYDDLGNALGFIKNSTDKYYYIRNLQNDIVGILDSGGTQVVEYVYDTWGKLESVTGTMAATIGRENPLRYRGYYYDEETGFYYLQSRYYDPETGRFINADETVLTGQGITSGNMYAYCGNNPVMRTDPSGSSYYDFYLGNASQRYAQSMGLGTGTYEQSKRIQSDYQMTGVPTPSSVSKPSPSKTPPSGGISVHKGSIRICTMGQTAKEYRIVIGFQKPHIPTQESPLMLTQFPISFCRLIPKIIQVTGWEIAHY